MSSTVSEGRQTAATWVAATGAFLLVAAAALFIVVRWDELSDGVKLGVLTALTGAALAGGRALQRELPATGNVVFHLGAFLVPVNVAAVLMRLSLDWRTFLLVEATAASLGFAGLSLLSRSPVLRWATAGSVVALCGGVAAVSPLPAGLVLAALSVAALLSGERRLAAVWAATAGLAPVLSAGVAYLVGSAGRGYGLGVLSDFGLSASQPFAVLAGAGSAVVLGAIAARDKSLLHALLAGASVVSSGLVSWLSSTERGNRDAVAAAVLFLSMELVALIAGRDAFWRRLSEPVVMTLEVFVAVITLPAMAVAVLLAPLADKGIDIFTDDPGWTPEPLLGAAAAITALAWLAAGLRLIRPREAGLLTAVSRVVGSPVTVVPISSSVVTAVAVGTASPLAAGFALLAVSAVLAWTGRPFALVVAAGAALWTPVTAHESPEAAALLGSVAAIVCAAAIGRHHVVVAALTLFGSASSVVIGWATLTDTIGSGASMTAAVAVLWLVVTAAGERSPTHGHVARVSYLIPLAIGALLPAADAFLICSAVALFLAIDAWRLTHRDLAVAAVVAAQIPIALGAHLAGFDLPGVGLVMCAVAVVAAGLGALVWPFWKAPVVAGVVTPLLIGLSLAAADPSALATALLITGGIAFVGALVTFEAWLAHIGALFVIGGTAVHLSVAGVEASEPYLAPIAVYLVGLGWHLRREHPVESWVAYGPAVALLGGGALIERVSGGPAWHAIVAGAVGVVAVSAGGWFRLIAPLVLGTAILGTVTVYESLATLATVPTWAWLALGGSALLGVGVALERTGTSPVDAGRRVADVLASRFD